MQRIIHCHVISSNVIKLFACFTQLRILFSIAVVPFKKSLHSKFKR